MAGRDAAASPQEVARRVADAMWADDRASQALGMRIESVGPGRAVLSMAVADSMLNGHGTCHGAFIFALADSAFAFACNSYNQRTVAFHCSVTYVAPGKPGDRLTATCEERTRQGRSGIYDARVVDQQGRLVAEFRGNSRSIPGKIVAELPGGEE